MPKLAALSKRDLRLVFKTLVFFLILDFRGGYNVFVITADAAM